MLLYYRYLAERPMPPLGSVAPAQIVVGPTERVVIVVLDSLREDAANDADVMPTFSRLARLGASGVNITPTMTLTTMSVYTIGTGMTPSISWSLKNFDAEPFQDESLISLAKASGRKVALLGDASWTQMFGRHADRTLAFLDKGWFVNEGGITPEDESTMKAAEEVLGTGDYGLVVIHLTSSDKAAHRSGAHRKEGDGTLSEYGRALRTYDQWIGEQQALYDRATWLVLSDHGCNMRGNHGGGEPEARRAPFVWVGPGITPGQRVEQPMTSLAATLAALLGLRGPRGAEEAVRSDLLDMPAADVTALVAAHLEAREGFVADYLAQSGLSLSASGTATGDPSARLAALDREERRVDEAFAWLGVAGMALGFGMQLALFLALGLLLGWQRPWLPALGWAGLSWCLLYFDQWQFPLIGLFGRITDSTGAFAIGAAALGGLGALLAPVVRRARTSPPIAWLLWAVLVLAIGQSVMRWPYGPLAEMYRAMLLVGVAVAAWQGADRRRALLCLALLSCLYAWLSFGLGDALEQRSEDAAFGWADLGVIALLAALIRDARPTRGRSLALWGCVVALTAGAIAYHIAREPWLIRLLAPLSLVPLVAAHHGVGDARTARNVSIAVALLLYRALSVDARVLILLGVAVVAWVASDARTRNTALTTPMAVGFALLFQQSYFYEAGYRYSFSALDMSVAFAATRDAIDLGEGFVFLLLQGLGPWLVLIACVLHNRARNGDGIGVQAAVLGLIGAFAVQSWGAFASFGYEIDNHWFTMHAVPLILFALCTTMVISVSVLGAMPAGRTSADGDVDVLDVGQATGPEH